MHLKIVPIVLFGCFFIVVVLFVVLFFVSSANKNLQVNDVLAIQLSILCRRRLLNCLAFASDIDCWLTNSLLKPKTKLKYLDSDESVYTCPLCMCTGIRALAFVRADLRIFTSDIPFIEQQQVSIVTEKKDN